MFCVVFQDKCLGELKMRDKRKGRYDKGFGSRITSLSYSTSRVTVRLYQTLQPTRQCDIIIMEGYIIYHTMIIMSHIPYHAIIIMSHGIVDIIPLTLSSWLQCLI